MLGSGWRVGEGERRRGEGVLCAGSVASFAEMEKLKVAGTVWGAEEAFLSPPEYGGPLAATFESEESSEDCEDYISGLAEEIAQSMLREDDDDDGTPKKTAAAWGAGLSKPASIGRQMATSPSSPQSTLAGWGGYNWEARSPGENYMGSSGVSSPPTPQEEGNAKDVLYADVLRLKLEDQMKRTSQQRMLSLQQQIIKRPSPPASTNAVVSSDKPFSLDDFPDLKTSSKYGRSKGGGHADLENYPFRGGSKHVGAGWGCGPTPHPNNNGGKGVINTTTTSNNNSSSSKRREETTPTYHQFSFFASSNSNMEGNNSRSWMMSRKQEGGGAGMRAVFLGSPTSREFGGTGVFLPRRLGSTQDSKRKPACSTVLLPSHIVHALNLNIEDTLSSPHQRDCSSSKPQWRRNPQAVSRRSMKSKPEVSSCYFPTSHSTTLQEVAPNISLPSEWTY